MSYYSPSIEKLIEAFERLPSIGKYNIPGMM